MRSRKRKSDGERGSVSVEFALAIPALLLLVLGGLHLGRAMSARHQLSDAAGYGARAASVAGAAAFNSGTVVNLVRQRLQGTSNCSGPPNVVVQRVGTQPYSRVTVVASCNLDIFGGTLLGGVGPTSVSVTASMPLN